MGLENSILYNGSMDRVVRVRGHDPLTVVELIIAFFLVIGGIYVLTPFLDVSVLLSEAPRAIQALGSRVGLAILGGTSVVVGITHIWSIFRYRYRVRAAMIFTHIMLRLYTIIATIIAQGVFPINWLNSLIIVLILSVCYLILKRKMNFFEEMRSWR